MEQGIRDVIERWHDMMSGSSHDGLFELLAEDCIFWSPVVHTPQRGRDITYLYVSAASQVFSDDFCYVSEMVDGSRAVLEFTCAIDDIQINGVDIIQVRDRQICEVKVMVRPLKALKKSARAHDAHAREAGGFYFISLAGEFFCYSDACSHRYPGLHFSS